ncbi:MAG: hypothetical protein V1717_01150 [Candidatus Micrarchaeota archaeon]
MRIKSMAGSTPLFSHPAETLVTEHLLLKKHSGEARSILDSLEKKGLNAGSLVGHIASGSLHFDSWLEHGDIASRKEFHAELRQLGLLIKIGHSRALDNGFRVNEETRQEYFAVRKALVAKFNRILFSLYTKGHEDVPRSVQGHFQTFVERLGHDRDVFHSVLLHLGVKPDEVFLGGHSQLVTSIREDDRGRFGAPAFKRILRSWHESNSSLLDGGYARLADRLLK